jgi:hypothetical protein
MLGSVRGLGLVVLCLCSGVPHQPDQCDSSDPSIITISLQQRRFVLRFLIEGSVMAPVLELLGPTINVRLSLRGAI